MLAPGGPGNIVTCRVAVELSGDVNCLHRTRGESGGRYGDPLRTPLESDVSWDTLTLPEGEPGHSCGRLGLLCW